MEARYLEVQAVALIQLIPQAALEQVIKVLLAVMVKLSMQVQVAVALA
jgi:hypothetical protein